MVYIDLTEDADQQEEEPMTVDGGEDAVADDGDDCSITSPDCILNILSWNLDGLDQSNLIKRTEAVIALIKK